MPRLTRIVLPALTSFDFIGDSEYMEDIVGQIDMPLLDWFHLRFFNQLMFDTPLLRDFLTRIVTFETPREAEICISGLNVRVTLSWRDGNHYRPTLSLDISCRPLDLQLSSLAQIFNSALSHLLTFEHLQIYSRRKHRQGEAENAQWLEVLLSCISVKDIVLHEDSITHVVPALEDLAGERVQRVTEVLPALQNIFVQSQQQSKPVKKAIGKFAAAHRLKGRPVTVHHRESLVRHYVVWEVGDR
jgi:hypothetical protein